MIQLRPQAHLARFDHKYPDAWRRIASFRAIKGQPGFEWPDFCYVPLAGAFAVISQGDERTMTPEKAVDVGRLGALAAWRLTKGVYRFDPTIFEAVWDTPLDGALPVELFYKLPEWCVYIEVPQRAHGGYELFGFFVSLEHDMSNGRPELRFVLDVGADSENMELVPLILHLTQGTLDECFQAALDEARRQQMRLGRAAWSLGEFADSGAFTAPELEAIARELRTILPPLLSLTLYLCSATVEMRDAKGKRERPGNPEAKKIKGEQKIFAAPEHTVWETGYRMGAALRGALSKAQQERDAPAPEGSSKPKAAHVRRAHWHTFLAGPRDALAREKRLKWLPPIPVGVEDFDDLPPTIHPVK